MPANASVDARMPGSDRRHGERRRLAPSVGLQRTSKTVCPRCGSHYLSRSATRWWERAFRAASHRVPFRCHSCSWRGWRKADWINLRPASPHAVDPGVEALTGEDNGTDLQTQARQHSQAP
jgi:hypothetical protein